MILIRVDVVLLCLKGFKGVGWIAGTFRTETTEVALFQRV